MTSVMENAEHRNLCDRVTLGRRWGLCDLSFEDAGGSRKFALRFLTHVLIQLLCDLLEANLQIGRIFLGLGRQDQQCGVRTHCLPLVIDPHGQICSAKTMCVALSVLVMVKSSNMIIDPTSFEAVRFAGVLVQLECASPNSRGGSSMAGGGLLQPAGGDLST